jgi:hypothetical protein
VRCMHSARARPHARACPAPVRAEASRSAQ